VLGLEYNETKEEIIVRILNGLMNLNSLAPVDDEDDVEEKDDRGLLSFAVLAKHTKRKMMNKGTKTSTKKGDQLE